MSIERRRRISAAFLPALLGGCLISTACGGSSQHSSTGNTASDPATRASHSGATSGAASVPGSAAGSRSSQNSASGSSASAPPAGAPAAGGAASPNHPSAASNAPPGGAGAAPARSSTNTPGSSGGSPSSPQFNPAVKQALNTFVACMHEHGANLPPPNTSGHGEVFNTNGIPNETLQNAVSSCEGQLLGILRAAGGAKLHGVEVTKR